MESTEHQPSAPEASAALDDAVASRAMLAQRLRTPPLFFTSIGVAIALQIALTAVGLSLSVGGGGITASPAGRLRSSWPASPSWSWWPACSWRHSGGSTASGSAVCSVGRAWDWRHRVGRLCAGAAGGDLGCDRLAMVVGRSPVRSSVVRLRDWRPTVVRGLSGASPHATRGGYRGQWRARGGRCTSPASRSSSSIADGQARPQRHRARTTEAAGHPDGCLRGRVQHRPRLPRGQRLGPVQASRRPRGRRTT